MFLPLSKINERTELAKEDSDVTYFHSLMYAGEQLTKLVTAGLVACIGDDRQRHKYRQVHRLVRADGIGEWSSVLDEVLNGPTSQFLIPEALTFQRDLNQRLQAGSWQFDSVSLLNDCLLEVDQSAQELATKVSGKTWFSLFAALRNKTRGHGALQPEVCSRICLDLDQSIKLIEDNFDLFKQPWAYLHRNLSGKYRVTYLTDKRDVFDHLKTNKHESFKDGIYLYLGKPIELDLVFSDPEASDFSFPNGGFTGKKFEILSYITGIKGEIDSTPYLTPAGELPSSETQGRGKLDLIGSVFTNLPPVPKPYISRVHLEEELRNILLDDRHPVITLVGRGGIGKTTLAISVLHQISTSNRYETIIWFSARDIDLLMEGSKPVKPHVLTEVDLANEFVKLIEPEEAKVKGFKAKSFVEGELAKSSIGPLLIILDNFETVTNPVDLYHWLNTFIRLPNKILITSRFRDFKADYPIEVKGMNEKEFKQLVASTVSELHINPELITENYLDELYSESDGHPYVVKILLGELVKAKKVEKIKRIVAGKEELLTALFERTYNSLSPAAKRIFMTLSNWRSTIPQLALEAVIMREDNEKMDVESALEELSRFSFIELSGSKKDNSTFVSVPLAASVFGQRKLAVSPYKTAIQADTYLLQAFGAGLDSQIDSGVGPRVNNFFRNIANRISTGKEELENYIPILEFISRQYPPAWITLSSLYKEESHFDEAKESLRSFLELTPNNEEDQKKGWKKLAQLCFQTKDFKEEAHALVELSTVPSVSFSDISLSMNRLIRIFQENNFTIDPDEKEILINRIIDTVNKRFSKGEGNDDDHSNLAWLYVHLNDKRKAKEIVKNVLSKNPGHVHSIKLYKILN